MVATKKEQIYSLNKENFSFNKEKFMKDKFRVKGSGYNIFQSELGINTTGFAQTWNSDFSRTNAEKESIFPAFFLLLGLSCNFQK